MMVRNDRFKLVATLRYNVYNGSSDCEVAGEDSDAVDGAEREKEIWRDLSKPCAAGWSKEHDHLSIPRMRLREMNSANRVSHQKEPTRSPSFSEVHTGMVNESDDAVSTGIRKISMTKGLPRESLGEATMKDKRFVGLMEKHGFVVLTDVGIIRQSYLEFIELLRNFFEEHTDNKEACKGSVHFNERGIPMWHAGYERCGRVREAFRVPTASTAASSAVSSASQLPWPCERLRSAWLSLLRLLQVVCHRALTLTLERPVHGAPPPRRKRSRNDMSRARDHIYVAQSHRTAGIKGKALDSRGAVTDDHGERSGRLNVRCSVCGDIRRRKVRTDAVGVGMHGGDCRSTGDATGSECVRRPVSAEAILPDEVMNRDKTAVTSEDRTELRYCTLDNGCCIEDERDGDGVTLNGEGLDCEDVDGNDDFSVSYALHYPNEFADPALEKEDLTVGEHVDPSLFVAEPCCGVEGLEIQDRSTGRWLAVESLCASLGANGRQSLGEAEGRELVLFGGKALERATGGRVQGAPHRVRRGDQGKRYCFIYEQKYAEFFPPPALD